MNPRVLPSGAAIGIGLAAVGFSLASTPVVAEGPSFDCARASTPVEKAICATPELARLDQELSVAWKAAQAGSPTPTTLKAAQRDFLQRRGRDIDGRYENPINVASLADDYRFRIEALQAEAERNRRAAAVALPPAELKRRCAFVVLKDCKVESAGPVSGGARYGGLVYQIQVPASDDVWERGLVVLRPEGAVLKVVAWNFEGENPEPAAVVATPDGPLLLLPSVGGGTGRANADLVFRPLPDGGWRDLDIDAWRKPFDKQLPDGVGVWKGVLYDWPTLTLETALWKSDDANCCPTGGSASARLTVKGDELALKSMSVDPTPPKGE